MANEKKARARAERTKATRDRRERMLIQGQRMSNWFYNMSQSVSIPDMIRIDMKRMCDDWDKIKRGEL